MKKRIVIIIGLGVLALLAAYLLKPERSPNVILITVDTLRADHLGAYGYSRQTSPNFDAFAKEGMLFRRAFSHAPETNPSMSSLMSSMYLHETKVFRNFHVLPSAVTTLAEVLKDRGWKTAAVVSNYSLRRGSGFEQGFEEYDDRMDDPGETMGMAAVQRIAPKTSAAAIEWLRQHRERKFFLWVHFMDPHVPYTPPAPYDTMFTTPSGERKEIPLLPKETLTSGRSVGGIPYSARLGDHTDLHYYVAQYDGEIRFLDESLGELLKEIRGLGLLDKSLVVLTADHGEGMGEHDFFFNHTEFVFTGLIHVPLVLRLPDRTGSGRQVDEPVSLLDVFPTILKVVGLAIPSEIKGAHLLDPQPRPILSFASFQPGHSTLIQNKRALVYDQGHPTLYDLDNDFYETRDLLEQGSPEDLALAKHMTDTMQVFAARDDLHLGPPVEWAILPDDKQKLRTLGYVQ